MLTWFLSLHLHSISVIAHLDVVVVVIVVAVVVVVVVVVVDAAIVGVIVMVIIDDHGHRAVAGVRPSVVLQCMTEPGCTTKRAI